jgi:ribosomal-protein-alanine N-acetyltransferase
VYLEDRSAIDSGKLEVLTGSLCRLRRYEHADVPQLPALAGDPDVARWMTHRFPHPYTHADAFAWVALASLESPVNNFAIDVGGALAGGIGILPRDGEERGVVTFGYWLGRPFWGRGIATEAAQLLAAHAFGERGLRRLEAYVFPPNTASSRVLEKAGFFFEVRLLEAVIDREGNVHDSLAYAQLASGRRPER